MTTATKPKERRLEARIDNELDDLIGEAVQRLHTTKSRFVSEALREAALKVVARADVTLMDPDVFDRMMASLTTPDDAPNLAALVAEPRQIAW